MKRFGWIYPEWWSLLISFLAWVAIVTQAFSAAHHHHDSWLSGVSHWMLMVLAMMLPFVIGPVRGTAVRSLWSRRHRAIAGFLLGYLVVWAPFGLIVPVVVSLLTFEVHLSTSLAAAAGFAMAALWQLAPAKQRALGACHRSMPLAPSGWRADADCFRYGCVIGSTCVTSCWALMLACSLAGHSLSAMLCGTAVGTLERYAPRVDRKAILGAISAIALIYAALALTLRRGRLIDH